MPHLVIRRVCGENHGTAGQGTRPPGTRQSGVSSERGHRGVPAGDAVAPPLTAGGEIVLVLGASRHGRQSRRRHLHG